VPKVPGQHICDGCGKEFVDTHHSNRKYCFRDCYFAHRPPLSPEIIAKLSSEKMGPKNPNWGKRPSPETVAKKSAAMMGNKNVLGHKQTPEHVEKRIATQRGRKLPPGWCVAISAAKIGKKRPDMVGDKNPAKRPDARAKISSGQAGPKNHRWLGGISREPYAWTFNDELKEEVRRRDGYECQLCGAPQAECRTALPVHHVDYDKKNSDPVNLTALCVSCNFKVNANREHWTGFFQAMALRRDIAMLSDSGKRIG